MPLNPAAVGAVGDVRTMSWNSKDALLYAVGIGAGQPKIFNKSYSRHSQLSQDREQRHQVRVRWPKSELSTGHC
jgi:hypothetical protein